jgi:hypothetical protein
MKNNFRDRRESSLLAVCGTDTTAKTATSLITKQLIKGRREAKKRRKVKSMKILLVYLHHLKAGKKSLMLKNQQRRRKAHEKGNCDNIFYVSS